MEFEDEMEKQKKKKKINRTNMIILGYFSEMNQKMAMKFNSMQNQHPILFWSELKYGHIYPAFSPYSTQESHFDK